MNIDILLTLLTSLLVVVGMVYNRWPPEWLVMAAVAFLMAVGILTPAAALHGFSNSGMLTVGALYVVAAGVQETGALRFITDRVLGRPNSTQKALLHLMPFTSVISAFLNNTPIVAMMMGVVQGWARKFNLPVSRLLLPLSYAAILGGTLTLIGTSTNLVVNGLLQSTLHIPGLHLFAISPVGLAVLIVGTVWMLLFGWRLLPKGKGLLGSLGEAREYSVVMCVEPKGALDNVSIHTGKLRQLVNGFLAEIEREGKLLASVNPDTVIQSGDRLLFVGSAQCAQEVSAIKGLSVDGQAALDLEKHERQFVEVVLSPNSPLVGNTIKKANFRSRYQAIVLAVSRNGQRVEDKPGSIVLKVGDTLLLDAKSDFESRYRHSAEFLLVSLLGKPEKSANAKRAPLALFLLVAMIVIHLLGWISMVGAAIIAAVLMVFTGCLKAERAAKSINGSVLIVIAGALAIGHAITSTGAASWVAAHIIDVAGNSPWLALALVYIVTAIFTEIITNNAAAVLMFPIGLALSNKLGINVMPFAIAIMFAASASFLTPLGYQTNLMVYGPGGYRLVDYFKAGLPMAILIAITSILVIPCFFPF